MKMYLVESLLVVLVCGVPVQAALPQAGPSKPTPLELHILIGRRTFRVGESITIRVELVNVGREDVFVGRSLDPIANAPSYVKLHFEDKHGNIFPGEELTVDFSQDAINQWWIPVEAGNYYGTEIKIDNTSYPFLSTPGKYLIRATYVSKGGVTPANVKWRIPAYRVWKGELHSNSVWIEILTPPPEPKKKK